MSDDEFMPDPSSEDLERLLAQVRKAYAEAGSAERKARTLHEMFGVRTPAAFTDQQKRAFAKWIDRVLCVGSNPLEFMLGCIEQFGGAEKWIPFFAAPDVLENHRDELRRFLAYLEDPPEVARFVGVPGGLADQATLLLIQWWEQSPFGAGLKFLSYPEIARVLEGFGTENAKNPGEHVRNRCRFVGLGENKPSPPLAKLETPKGGREFRIVAR
jgi:hypothetical protein